MNRRKGMGTFLALSAVGIVCLGVVGGLSKGFREWDTRKWFERNTSDGSTPSTEDTSVTDGTSTSDGDGTEGYIITFDSNGGLLRTSDTRVADAESNKLSFLPTPERFCHDFVGWANEDGLMVDTDTVYDGDATLRAIWRKCGVGDTFKFGMYPQSKSSFSSNFLSLFLPGATNFSSWTSYGYYAEGTQDDFMHYYDNLDMFGVRGVHFSNYRPGYVFDSMPTNDINMSQHENGYDSGTSYWFDYEYVEWKVLGFEGGNYICVSSKILDSQAYACTDSYAFADTRNRDGMDVYDNNYMASDVRDWLNTTFVDTAFNGDEKELLQSMKVDNSSESTMSTDENVYACDDTEDRVTLLSWKEIKAYLADDTSAEPTEYAKSQGLECTREGYPLYWTRSPLDSYAYIAKCTGNSNKGVGVNFTAIGIRPVIMGSL